MSKTPRALLAPIPVERIRVNEHHDCAPTIRDTGIHVADVSLGLGPEHLTDVELLDRFPELEPADVEAVRIYSDPRRAPVEFDVILDRVLGPDPAHDDVLVAYLYLPRVVLSYHRHDHMGVPMKVRSSFEAASTDATNSRGLWLAAIGHLVLLDQIGTALARSDYDDIERPWRVSSAERALERFSDITERERATLYALRNALAHDFSLVNISRSNKPERRAQLLHAFALHGGARKALITFPSPPWDGNLRAVNETHVDLSHLAELMTKVQARIFDCYDRGTLALVLSAEETRRRYIFTHGVSIEEWEEQRQADQVVRWGEP